MWTEGRSLPEAGCREYKFFEGRSCLIDYSLFSCCHRGCLFSSRFCQRCGGLNGFQLGPRCSTGRALALKPKFKLSTKERANSNFKEPQREDVISCAMKAVGAASPWCQHCLWFTEII